MPAVIRSVFSELRTIRTVLEGRLKPLYTVEEFAQLVGRDPYTVRAWIKAGKLRATRVAGTGPRGRLLIAREEVDRLVAGGLGGRVPESAVR